MSTDTTPRYPIGDVAAITGVNPVTLRAWQRRFGLLKPGRTPKGHRLYSEADIDRVRQILSWLDKGVAISQVRSLLEDPSTPTPDDPWLVHQATLTQAAVDMNGDKLFRELDQLTALYTFERTLCKALRPWLDTLEARSGERADGRLLLNWTQHQLQLYLQGHCSRGQSQLSGDPALLMLLRTAPVEAAITALSLTQQGEKFSQLPTEDLDGCQLRSPRTWLLCLPAKLRSDERQQLARLQARGIPLTVVGPFAALYHDDPLFQESRHD
ncbi:MerR family transcriptional regulator [Ferrimonas futtsuensis]|uniref:MerR family transcriptional regulator n=1 Tax=Ferrimonas futtsuensis TaxID=364764 RepID=UPI00040887A1|nr:MerR family transcriptional regulator [Ferrimonas futtsuensis]